ncbi:MAG: hypothetical protein WCE36_17080, partial [Pseudolabrys sp.]
NPKATTGKYKCLFQLSDWEFAKYWHGDIYDIRDCSIAAARKVATEAAQFEKDVGRKATAGRNLLHPPAGVSRLCVSLRGARTAGMEEHVPDC